MKPKEIRDLQNMSKETSARDVFTKVNRCVWPKRTVDLIAGDNEHQWPQKGFKVWLWSLEREDLSEERE